MANEGKKVKTKIFKIPLDGFRRQTDTQRYQRQRDLSTTDTKMDGHQNLMAFYLSFLRRQAPFDAGRCVCPTIIHSTYQIYNVIT